MKINFWGQSILTLLVLLPLLLSMESVGAQTATERVEQQVLVQHLKQGVAKVYAWKPGNVVDVGAAVMLGEQDDKIYFVSAYHIVEDAEIIKIETFGNRGPQIQVSTFGDRFDPKHDLVVLVGSRYQISGTDQLYERDLNNLSSNDTTHIIGHPQNDQWVIATATIDSINSTRILLHRGVVKNRYSGGPLIDRYGKLLGVVIGNTSNELGEVVRIDVVLQVLDSWGVPYRTKMAVNFCNILTQIITSSLDDFVNMKGAQVTSQLRDETTWTFLDKSMDITGTGGSSLVRNFRVRGATQYIADFGRQRDETEGLRVWKEVVGQSVVNCLPPDKKGRPESAYLKGKRCLVASYRKSMWDDPIQFVIHLDYGNEVRLYMHRGYSLPYGICD